MADQTIRFLRFSDRTDDQIEELLKANRIGTPGKSIIYQHRFIGDKLKEIQDPLFVRLELHGHLLGMVCLSKRTVRLHGKDVKSAYIRYFTFRESLRATGETNDKNRNRKSPLREEIMLLMSGNIPEMKDIDFLYAYADPRNFRSTRLIEEFGMKKVSSFSVIVFSRFFPSFSKNVTFAETDDMPFIRKRLRAFYDKEQLVGFDNLSFKDGYFLLKENGQEICGAQGVPEEWIIQDMPGARGWVLMNLIPHMPVLNRLFKPQFRFLLIEGIFYAKGKEKALEKLFSSMLAHYNVNSAVLCIDPGSHVHQSIQSIDLGIINRLQEVSYQDVFVKNLKGSNPENLSPVYISGIDVL